MRMLLPYLRGRFETRMSRAQLIEQRLSFFQIERIEATGEPAVGQSKQIGCLILLSLIASAYMLINGRSSQGFACCRHKAGHDEA